MGRALYSIGSTSSNPELVLLIRKAEMRAAERLRPIVVVVVVVVVSRAVTQSREVRG
jgi:hypothetical protein